MIKAIAIDDEPLALEILAHYCNRTELICLEGIFTSTGAARLYLEAHVVNLLFLNISMANVSGLDFYTSLPGKIVCIFTTPHSEYAIDGFNLKAADFLIKPFQYSRFLQAVEKARMQVAILQQSGLFH